MYSLSQNGKPIVYDIIITTYRSLVNRDNIFFILIFMCRFKAFGKPIAEMTEKTSPVQGDVFSTISATPHNCVCGGLRKRCIHNKYRKADPCSFAGTGNQNKAGASRKEAPAFERILQHPELLRVCLLMGMHGGRSSETWLRSYRGYCVSFSRSARVMPSKNSSIIRSSLSHMGLALQHSVREQAVAP